jgi:hypothetical protein
MSNSSWRCTFFMIRLRFWNSYGARRRR